MNTTLHARVVADPCVTEFTANSEAMNNYAALLCAHLLQAASAVVCSRECRVDAKGKGVCQGQNLRQVPPVPLVRLALVASRAGEGEVGND